MGTENRKDLPLDQGLGLPVLRKSQGYFAPQRGTDLTRTAFLLILGTRLGERVMQPNLGSQIPNMLFEPNDAILRQLLEIFTKDAISEQQNRARLEDFRIQVTNSTVEMTLVYRENRETSRGVNRLELTIPRS